MRLESRSVGELLCVTQMLLDDGELGVQWLLLWPLLG